MFRKYVPLIGLLIVGAALLASCGTKTPPAAVGPVAGQTRHDQDEHGHAKGIVAMGDYHAKLLVEQGGKMRVIVLGKDETKEARIESKEVAGFVRAADGTEDVPVTLTPEPLTGDPAGQTSQFVGQVPEPLRGKALTVTLRILINGEAYRPTFDTVARHEEMAPQPPAAGTAKERDVFLTPKGRYTADDIKKNGNMIASEKFKGIPSAHDSHPKPGDRVCPISGSKANPQFTWYVGGKAYQFCCPPCVYEFVKSAKEEPDTIQDPETYVQR